MATNLDITLSSTLLDDLTPKVGTDVSAIYLVGFDKASPEIAIIDQTLAVDGIVTGGAPVTINGTLSAEAITVPLPDLLESGKIYLVVESNNRVSQENSLADLIKVQSNINPTNAETYDFGYDSVEMNLSNASTDVGNLTSVVQFGLPMAIGVSYGSSGGTASVGYKVSGTNIVSSLSRSGAKETDYSSGPMEGKFQSEIPPTSTSDWSDYVASLEGTKASPITLSGFFNGAADGNNIYHNAGYFSYQLEWNSTQGVFWLTPLASSQIKGDIMLSPTQLEDSIYQTDGTAYVFSSTISTATENAFATINTGANDQWGTVLRQLLVGLNAGYVGSTGEAVNPQLPGDTLDLNQSYNWNPDDAWGQNLVSNPGTFQTYNRYASVFGLESNSYGYGYSDAQTAAYISGGPLLPLATPRTSIDVSTINLTVFGQTDTPSGYTAPTLDNYVPPPTSGSYAIPDTLSTDNIKLDFASNDGENAGVELGANDTVVLGIMTSDAGGTPTFTDVTLTAGSSSLWSEWKIGTVSQNGTISYTATATATSGQEGVMQIDNLPVNAMGGVSWYQVTAENSITSQEFNLYLTGAVSSEINTGTITSNFNDPTITSATATGTLAPILNSAIDGATIVNATTNPNGFLTAGTIIGGTIEAFQISTATLNGGTVSGTLGTGYILHDGTLDSGTVVGDTINNGFLNHATVGIGQQITISGGITAGSTITDATLTGSFTFDGAEFNGGTISGTGALNKPVITGGTTISPVLFENPYYIGQEASAGVDGLAEVTGETGTASVLKYTNSLDYDLAGASGTALNPALFVPDTATSVVNGLEQPWAPIAGTIGTTGTFEALAGQTLPGTTLTVDGTLTPFINTITTSSENLRFAWTGENNVAKGTSLASWISSYTNKINAEDTALVEISSPSSGSIFTTAVADLDGEWQTTAGISLNPGTYDVTMVDRLPGGATVSGESAPLVLVEDGTPCFCAGTYILTDAGEAAVETLAIGDKVMTFCGRFRTIKWIGRRSFAGVFVAANRNIWPIRIAAGAMADNVPARDLYVSPEHAMYIDKRLVQAKHLVNGRNVSVVESPERIEYFHIELETHDVIFAEGAATETFVDCSSRGMFHNAAEFATLYPDAKPRQWAFYAPMLEEGRKLTAIQRRLLSRAEANGDAEPAGVVEGYLEAAEPDMIRGWAWIRGNAHSTVMLEVLDGETVIGTVLANEYRGDLADAGIGTGRHSFRLRPARPLDFSKRHAISVRAKACGTLLIGSPSVIEPAETVDSVMIRSLRDQVSLAFPYARTVEEADSLLAMLVALAEQAKQRHATLLTEAGPMRRQRGTAAKIAARRALVIDDVWPRQDRDAGAQAIVSHVRALQKLSWHVSFIARTGAPQNAAAIAGLEKQGIVCLAPPAMASVEEALSRQAGQFDLVYLHRATVAPLYAGLIRHYQPQARLIYSVADLHHVRLARQSMVEDRPELRAAAARLRQQEVAAMREADVVITHSPAEAAYLLEKELVAPGKLHTVRWAVPARRREENEAGRNGVLFVANFAHKPNCDGLNWFAREVIPKLKAQLPGLPVTVAGFGVSGALTRELEERGIEVAGHVPDLAPLYANARLAIAPLRFGAGIKGKVLEAWSHGIPCAMTPVAAEGLPCGHALAGAVANDAEGFARIVVTLHEDAAASAAHVVAGRRLLRAEFSQAAVTAGLARAVKKFPQGFERNPVTHSGNHG